MPSPDDHLRPNLPPEPAPVNVRPRRKFRRLRRWYRRTPTGELVMTLAAVVVLVLVVVAAVLYLVLT